MGRIILFLQNTLTSLKRKPVYLLMIIWTLTSADQCVPSDACGNFGFILGSGVVRMNLITNIPQGAPRPVMEEIIPYQYPQINITKSLKYVNPTFFSIKVESYDQCNGLPRYKNVCCNTDLGSCFTTENDVELPVSWNAYFKTKVTIRAISFALSGYGNNFNTYYVIYESTFDIAANITSLSYPFNNIINLTFKGAYREYSNYTIPYQICSNY